MLFLWATWFYRNWDYRIADQLAWPLIETDNWAFWIKGLLINIQYVFHMPDEITRDLSYAPAGL
jgi:hypothetical protein